MEFIRVIGNDYLSLTAVVVAGVLFLVVVHKEVGKSPLFLVAAFSLMLFCLVWAVIPLMSLAFSYELLGFAITWSIVYFVGAFALSTTSILFIYLLKKKQRHQRLSGAVGNVIKS